MDEHQTPTRPRRSRPGLRLGTTLALAGLVVVATACGGEAAGSGGVASLGDDRGGDAADGAEQGGSDQSFEEALLAFSRCMREQGIDMPDPELGGRGAGMVVVGPGVGGGPSASEEELRTADEECGHLIEGFEPDLSPEEQDRMEDDMLAFARCMRERGIDVPDPEPGGGMRMEIGADGVDPRDPDFQAAEKICRPKGAAVEPSAAGAVRS